MRRNEVNFKALTFISEQTASTFNYEVKGVRALWDPSLSIPGTNRRGGWRCPVGTRYGGQITDRFGRSCGWGVARRIANQIADIGERLENIDDRKRNNRLAKRNARMQRLLARQQKPSLLERGARGVAQALDGGQTPQQRPRIPVRQQRPQIPVQPPQLPVADIDSVPPRPRRRRGNLRESEQRRMERELVEPGAPRTGEPPKPNESRGRRRASTQQGAKRTVRRKPEADFVDGAKPVPTAVPQRKPPSAPPKPLVVEPDPNFNAPDLGGSLPDARSERNVRNRFREEGLPDTAYWREEDFPEGEEKAELERRFGRYYGEDKKRNARGDYVNRRIKAGAGKPANRSKPPARPKTPAEIPPPPPMPPTPKAPNVPAGPRPIRRVLDVDGQFNQANDAEMLGIVKNNLNAYEPNTYNNLRGLSKEQLEGNLARLKQEQIELDEKFGRALDDWMRDKNLPGEKRSNARTVLAQAHINRERNKLAQEAVNLRMAEIGAGIEWRQKLPKPLANVPQPQVLVPQAPIADVPEPEGGFDVSPPISKDDHRPNLLGKIGEDGLPDVKGVPMGNKGLNFKGEAIVHLERGGDLADVPDDLLRDALLGATGRFQTENLGGGGVNANKAGNMTLFSDTLTGKKYYLKYQVKSEAKNEDLHEIVGNNLAGRFGFPIGGFRMDGKQSEGFLANQPAAMIGRSVLFEHAGNYVDGRLTAGRDAIARDIKASDRVRATLMDFVMVNRDRHGGNYFVSTDANGKRRFVPIDPSLGFDAEYGGQVHIGHGADDAGFMGWLGHEYGGRRNDMLVSLRQQYLNGTLSRREVTAIVSDVQKSIREAERKNPYMNMVEDALLVVGADGKQRPVVVGNIARRPQGKMKYITDVDPTRIAELILGI